MPCVIIRDDDTNAFTPAECLERLYRPFLNRGMPVNLAVIPDVATGTTTPDGNEEGYLVAKNGTPEPTVPIGSNSGLVRYILSNPGYRVLQHGCHHDYFEFDRNSSAEIADRLDRGRRKLAEAGLGEPVTFVAPYDRLSRVAMKAVARRFRVLSTGWFELRRLPRAWWPRYLAKKLRQNSHWRVSGTLLMSHPGCLLSCHRPYESMLTEVIQAVNSRPVTVLVTHWWEYFRGSVPDTPLIDVLHATADYLASQPDIEVISFGDLERSRRRLN